MVVHVRYELNTHPEIQEHIDRGSIVLLPMGQLEQHGHHLPVGTDAILAERIAALVADRVQGRVPVVVMPTIWYGYSQLAMAQWPGLIRLRPHTVTDMLYDICASLVRMGFRKLVFINCHGENPSFIDAAIRQVRDDFGVDQVYLVNTFPLAMAGDTVAKIRRSGPGGIHHACEYETAAMLYFDQPVRMDRVTADDVVRYHSEFYSGDGAMGSRIVQTVWAVQRSKTGTMGDPSVATRETGEAFIQAIVDAYERFLQEFHQFRTLD